MYLNVIKEENVDFAKAVQQGLDSYNRASPYAQSITRDGGFYIALQDENGTYKGGWIVKQTADWAFLDLAYVDPDCRRSGWGFKALDLIETEAKSKGLKGIYTATVSFQAPEFYKKVGYKEIGRLKEYADNYDKVFLAKRF